MIYSDNDTSFGEDDKEALRILVRKILKPGCRILEVGSWLGAGSTKVIIDELATVEGGSLYCVDTWKGSENVAHHQNIIADYDVLEIFMHNVRQAGGESFVHPLVMCSKDAAPTFEDGSFDLVFIDGDHSYASASEDISLWKSKVREGGILCGHDCECRPKGFLRDAICSSLDTDFIAGDGTPFLVIHPGVVVAVDEAFEGSANLWAEAPFLRPDGTIGRATLWDNLSLPATVSAHVPSTDHSPPRLVGSELGYNIVLFKDVHCAVPQSLGPMDLSEMNMASLPPEVLVGRFYEDVLLRILVVELKAMQEQIRQLPAELISIQEQASKLPAELKSVQDQMRELPAELKSVQEQVRQLPGELKAVQEQLRQLPGELKAVQEQLRQLPAEPGSLQE